MKLAAICLGRPEILQGKSYKTGINKMPVKGSTLVDRAGLVGDSVCNRKHHGGPDQAILLEGELTMAWWSRRLGRELRPGTFGENLRIDALDGRDVCIGDRFVFAEVVLQATAPRIPCATFAARMGEHDFARRYLAAGRLGIYCRVLREGIGARGGGAVRALRRRQGSSRGSSSRGRRAVKPAGPVPASGAADRGTLAQTVLDGLSPQKGSFIPGGIGSPAVSSLVMSAAVLSAFFLAS